LLNCIWFPSLVEKKTGTNGEGIEILVNEPYEDQKGKGQFTHKRIYLGSHIPTWAKSIMPSSVLYVEEKAWNSYPYVKTMYWCPFFGERFSITQETRYFDNDDGTQENALNLSPEILNQREVDYIDIVTDTVDPRYYKKEEDPKFFTSQKTGRGPLQEGWKSSTTPMMWVYKVASVEFRYWGFQTKVESWLHKSMVRDVLVLGHKQAFTWIDEWWGLTMDKIRKIEQETKIILDKLRNGEKVDSIAIDVSRFNDDPVESKKESPKTTSSTIDEVKEPEI